MSNVMSRSKSRWKGALLATVAGAVVSPMAAKASLTVGVYLNPIGTGIQTSNYLTPDQTGTAIPLYVYATVTGANPVTQTTGSGTISPSTFISSGDFNGLQYLYYNLLATGGSTTGITGGITSTVLNSNLGFDSTTITDPSNSSSGSTASQAGLVGLTPGSTLAGGATVVAVGAPSALGATSPVSSTAMTQFAKPRAGQAVWSNYASQNASANSFTYLNDGKNIIIGTGSNGLLTNQVAFLVETIYYTPSAFVPSTIAGNRSSITFSIQAPFNSGGGSILASTSYAPSNSFADSNVSSYSYTSSAGSSLAGITSSNYSAGHSVTLTDTAPGDATANGTVDFSDLSEVLTHYLDADTKWADGNFLYYSNSSAGTITFADLSTVLTSYLDNIGSAPSVMGADAALLDDPQAVAALEAAGITPVSLSAVPEPASLGVLTVLAAAGLRRRRR